MARKVFFSFHFARDVFRVNQVRNSWVVRPGDTAQPFYDKAEFEQAKQRAGGIEKWIESQLAGTSVTVVLYGAETSARPWVLHEIRRSVALGKGLLAISIHNIKDPRTGTAPRGVNPLSTLSVNRGGVATLISRVWSDYDWVNDDGRQNMPAWIEAAAHAVGR